MQSAEAPDGRQVPLSAYRAHGARRCLVLFLVRHMYMIALSDGVYG